MSEEISDTMNLDLNLGPGPETPQLLSNEAMNLDDWNSDSSERVREAASRIRSRQRYRWRQLQIPIPVETQNLSLELDQLIGSSGNSIALQTGEGSIAAEERVDGEPKMCENGNGISDDSVSEKNGAEKSDEKDGSFFDCNICLDLSKEPVVTCCGHLFCWACLYRWLHLHSDAKECPVCKGEVTLKTLTPIYGRGTIRREPEQEDPDVKIPMRPHARRIESLRQTLLRHPFSSHMEEVMRRFQSRFDRGSNSVTEFSNNNHGAAEMHERASSLINRFLTSRGLRGEQNQVSASSEDIDLSQNMTSDIEPGASRFPPLYLRRQLQTQRGSRISSLSSALVDTYFRSPPLGRDHPEQNPPVDDTDSFSSIAAVINSESQVDTAAEIDSIVALSASSSRRRNGFASRVSDLDSVDSRAPQRRRLS